MSAHPTDGSKHLRSTIPAQVGQRVPGLAIVAVNADEVLLRKASGAGPDARSSTATVRHLRSHSSGLANPMPLRWGHLVSQPGPATGHDGGSSQKGCGEGLRDA